MKRFTFYTASQVDRFLTDLKSLNVRYALRNEGSFYSVAVSNLDYLIARSVF